MAGSPPVADFTSAPQNDGTPLTVNFTDTSTNTPTSWAWDFGDGSTSTLQNPSHTFDTIGTFTVSLTATNAAGSSAPTTQTITTLPSFNCSCNDTNNSETLSQLRRRLLVRLGFSAQADTPPPGMADLLNDFLIGSQRYLYLKYPALRTERFFSWVMTPGIRFYDVDANTDVCTKRLNTYRIEGVWLEDLNGVWLQMYAHIPPEFYTSVKFNGYPSRYEIRQCIEVFPAPSAAYTLWVKAQYQLESFSADSDPTTIDSELVFLWALGQAKAHYGHPDATMIANQATDYLKQLVAGTHTGARYVPGVSPTMPYTKPRFLPLDNP